MDTSSVGLAAFLEEYRTGILERWQQFAARAAEGAQTSRLVLRNDIDRIIDKIVTQLASKEPFDKYCVDHQSSCAVREHIIHRAEIGATLEAVIAELMALRDTIEEAWPPRQFAEAREALLALRNAVDRIVLASIERFNRIRTTLVVTIDEIVRSYPGRSLDETLQAILKVLLKAMEGIDTATILLREGNVLRVRAAVGLEEGVGFTLHAGEGFAGFIIAERKPRLVQGSSAIDSLVLNPIVRGAGLKALYGIPLIRADDVLGVAHLGSQSAEDFSTEAKALFRMIMDRIVGILAQELLRERLEFHEAQHKAVLDNSPVVIYSKDLEGRYVTINRRATVDLGLTPEQFIGHTAHDVFPKEIADQLSERDRRVMEQGVTVESEDVVIRRDNQRRTYLSIKFPTRNACGEIIGIGGVATDITERRRWERAQTLLLDVSDMLVSSLGCEELLPKLARLAIPLLADCCMIELVDEQGTPRRVVVEHRDPAKAILAQEILDTPLDRSKPYLGDAVLESSDPVAVAMSDVSENYLDSISQSERERQLLGALHPTSMILTPLRGHHGLLGAWVFIRCGLSTQYDKTDIQFATDLAWRTSLAIENARLYRSAERASRGREEIVGIVAHDLRNPVGTILLAVDQLKQRVSSERDEIQQMLNVIGRSAGRIVRLASDLLDQHAIETGQLSIRTKIYPAAELVQDAIQAVSSRIQSAGVSLETSISEHLPDVLADKERILQVFANLIDNACKFTPAGGRVTIGAARNDGEARFFIRDSGPGIPEAALKHVFDRYWRARRGDCRGLGLGLSICKGIVEAHQGRIWAINQPEGGAAFFFTLPEAPV